MAAILAWKPSQVAKLYCLVNRGTLVWTTCPRSLQCHIILYVYGLDRSTCTSHLTMHRTIGLTDMSNPSPLARSIVKCLVTAFPVVWTCWMWRLCSLAQAMYEDGVWRNPAEGTTKEHLVLLCQRGHGELVCPVRMLGIVIIGYRESSGQPTDPWK